MTEQNWALARKKQILAERARIIQNIRAFFVAGEFLEIETPHRVPANAPEPHIDAIESDGWFLQTSPELAMKRLLAAGYERLFQICRVWRGSERGRRHLPEFSMLEWYRANADYHRLMTDCIDLFLHLVPKQIISWQGQTIDLTPPWETLSVHQAFALHTDLTPEQALQEGRFDEILSFKIEPRLGRDKPTFLVEYPAELAALARRQPQNRGIAERFELYVCGLELANAFSELSDPVEQRARFDRDETHRRTAGKTPYPSPEKFLSELAAMPEAAGIAFGIDRLIMLLTDRADIAEVVAFPPESL
jgi:lysyl-tRNA synthetase class 2